jgi:GNAT superfamily N-acetyltransferase
MIRYADSPAVGNDDLNDLFAASWDGWHSPRDFTPILARGLGYVCAFDGERLVGFVNVAWDGGEHAFLLDPTVRPELRRRGIGTRLVHEATRLARAAGAAWLHVDFEPHLRGFYLGPCGFTPTNAGLIRLRQGGIKQTEGVGAE